ncbi:Pyridoxal phosphate-dependent transferase [Elaphomyces granulatus]
MLHEAGTSSFAEYGGQGYCEAVEALREREYPLLKDTTYLDHAGTTPYAKSLIESFSRDLTSNLFGNPHSASSSSQLTTHRVDDVRLRVLRFFNAEPDDFDVVFVANATAGIKLVADALRDYEASGFWYGYHVDAHTSLIGVREIAERGSKCFLTDDEVEEWIVRLNKEAPLSNDSSVTKLFAFPAQSNMTGRRLPLRWCEEIQKLGVGNERRTFTLLDAAGLVSTAPLDLSDLSFAPDFVVLSFYKIFGFPDLGALIVRKDANHVFHQRRYFGGGTVDMVIAAGDRWHSKKNASLHDRLEDGTLPFHSIVALDSAFETHKRLYGSMANISCHAGFLAKKLFDRLSSMAHYNEVAVCQTYTDLSDYSDRSTQGPIIAFNLRNSHGEWVGKSEVEKLASVKNIQLRSGTLCNPGGAANHLGLSPTDMKRNFNAGQRCGDDHDVIDGKPTGALRVSLGAMSDLRDVMTFIRFVEEFYIDNGPTIRMLTPTVESTAKSRFYVESLCVYPIKSCGGFKIPSGTHWEVKREGLAWDREWCLIYRGTGKALSQKKHPKMALIRPYLDFDRHILRVTCGDARSVEVSLAGNDPDLTTTEVCSSSIKMASDVCGDRVVVNMYSSPEIAAFFSDFLGVLCTLARFPSHVSTRYSKVRRSDRRSPGISRSIMPGSFPESCRSSTDLQIPILLSNESPILIISRSSVNRLNENIKANAKNGSSTSKAVVADVFRANIVVAESVLTSQQSSGDFEQPYIEDAWTSLRIGPQELMFDVLGSCQRCQLVCVDQFTAVRSEEPFSTLAKTRRIDGKVVFGRHISLSSDPERALLMVGDAVKPHHN